MGNAANDWCCRGVLSACNPSLLAMSRGWTFICIVWKDELGHAAFVVAYCCCCCSGKNVLFIAKEKKQGKSEAKKKQARRIKGTKDRKRVQ